MFNQKLGSSRTLIGSVQKNFAAPIGAFSARPTATHVPEDEEVTDMRSVTMLPDATLLEEATTIQPGSEYVETELLDDLEFPWEDDDAMPMEAAECETPAFKKRRT